MERVNKHIIEKQYIEIEMRGKLDAFNFKDELSDICTNKLLSEIEKLFDNKIPDDRTIRIDKLEIDAGNVSLENWKTGFVENVVENLSQYIENLCMAENESDGLNFVNKEKNNSEIILSFLETGYLPWYSKVQNRSGLQENLKEILKNKDYTSKLSELINTNQNALQRLICQFDVKHIDMLLEDILHKYLTQDLLNKWMSSLKNLCQKDSKQIELIYHTALEAANNKGSEETFLRNASGLLHEKQIVEPELKKIDPEEKFIKQIREEWYVKNSGVIIIHPFLLSLFENTGYIENKEWIGIEQQQRAITLLQYAVTGVEEYPEFDLMLNKIICGYEISESLPSEIQLSEFEKNEADELLRSVIKHWTALKNTSINGLRETFLKRNGKLLREDKGWFLQAEVKTVDILINKLPWGMSMIKLPWMKEMLRVEWNY